MKTIKTFFNNVNISVGIILFVIMLLFYLFLEVAHQIITYPYMCMDKFYLGYIKARNDEHPDPASIKYPIGTLIKLNGLILAHWTVTIMTSLVIVLLLRFTGIIDISIPWV